jgi:enoyl-CoA hydratase/carnithine racemase
MGAGLEMACCCDIRMASTSARFGAPIAQLGFPMAPREAQLVARELGLAVAREMLLAAAIQDAHRMRDSGFLNQVCEEQELVQQALMMAQRIARLAPQAARLNKQTLRGFCVPSAESGGENARQKFAAAEDFSAYHYASSAEHREGVDAFLSKRKPDFR